MSNFRYVQTTPGGHGTSATFPAATTRGNLIIVATFNAGATSVTDTRGNTYHRLVWGWGYIFGEIWAAVSIAGGTCTVTAAGVEGMIATEYSSREPQYYVSAGHVSASGNPTITSADSNNGGGGSNPGSWLSSKEVTVVFSAFGQTQGVQGLYPAYYSIGAGSIRWQGVIGGYLDFGLLADDNVPNVNTTYNNSPVTFVNSVPGNYATLAQSMCVFLNLTDTAGIASTPIIYARRPRGNIDMDQIQPRVLRGGLTGDWIATHSGSFTAGNVPTWDTLGNLVDTSAAALKKAVVPFTSAGTVSFVNTTGTAAAIVMILNSSGSPITPATLVITATNIAITFSTTQTGIVVAIG